MQGEKALFETVTAVISVRPGDMAAGHVNNARVLELLEYGRWAWFRHQRLAYVDGPILPLVTRIEVDYRKEIFMGDLRVETRLSENSTHRTVLEQSIYVSPDGVKPLVTAKVYGAFVGVGDRKLRTFEAFLLENKKSTTP